MPVFKMPASEQGSGSLSSICLFDLGYFDFAHGVVGPKGQCVLADNNENLVRPHSLFLPMLFQLVHRNPMSRVAIVHPPTQLLACDGVALVPQMHNIRNQLVLLRFRQV
jgi:hypothetical protein